MTVHTDHKPLIGLCKIDFDSITPRLQRLFLRLQRYNVHLVYVPGRHLTVTDALSCAADTSLHTDTSDLEQCRVMTLITASTIKLQELRIAMKKDPVLQKVTQYVQHGWPKHQSVDPPARPCAHCQDEHHL